MATAATPKGSFKRTLAGTVEGRSPRFLLVSLALAMVISLVAGLGIGIKVGEHNKSTTKPVATVKPKPIRKPIRKPPVRTVSGFARPPLNGTVVRTVPRALVMAALKRRIAITITPRTRIEVVRPATRSDIKAGSRVLFVLGPATFAAREILVVTGFAGNRIGSVVSSVTASSMSFKARNGKIVTISTVGATVSKTLAATRAKLLRGRHILVKSVLPAAPKKKPRARAPKRRPVAVEIIALPDGSAFG